MSFHFFLDSGGGGNEGDDTDDDLDLDAFDDTGLLALLASRGTNKAAAASSSSSSSASPSIVDRSAAKTKGEAASTNNENVDWDDDDDDIDWEDADPHEEEEEEDDDAWQRHPSFPTRGVMINIGKRVGRSNHPEEQHPHPPHETIIIDQGKDDDDYEIHPSPSKKRKKRSTIRVLRNVPPQTQQMILNIRRTQLLCGIARSLQCSSLAACWGSNPGSSSSSSASGGGKEYFESEDDDRLSLLAHVAYSLIPQEFHDESMEVVSSPTIPPKCHAKSKKYTIPSKQKLRAFSQWYFQFMNQCGERRRDALRRNIAHGAASASTPIAATSSSTTASRKRRRNLPGKLMAEQSTNDRRSATKEAPRSSDTCYYSQPPLNVVVGDRSAITNRPADLLRKVLYLSPHYDDDPQLLMEEEDGAVVNVIDAVERITDHDKALLFLFMARLIGWRARYVTSFRPMPLVLTVDHPLLLLLNARKFQSSSSSKSKSASSSLDRRPPHVNADDVIKLIRFVLEQQCLSPTHNNENTCNSFGRRERTRQASKMMSAADANEVRTMGTTCHTDSTTVHPSAPDAPSWVEILCRGTTSEDGAGKRPSSNDARCSTNDDDNGAGAAITMWVPILPAQESFDRPEDVESILAWMEAEGEKSRIHHDIRDTIMGDETKKKGRRSKSPDKSSSKRWHRAKPSPVSYVLAVEHASVPLKSDQNLSFDSQFRGEQWKRRAVRLTDVTPRYANSWSRTLRLRGASGKEIAASGGICVDAWWSESLMRINSHFASKWYPIRTTTAASSIAVTKSKSASSTGREIDVIEVESSGGSDTDEHEQCETTALAVDIAKQKIPTSKAQFKQSPFFVIPSVLNSREVLHPDARERICGVFKGELVYRRSDVSKAMRAAKWPYHGRKVKECEIHNPVKRTKARKRTSNQGFAALSSYGTSKIIAQEDNTPSTTVEAEGDKDGMISLYGVWQTDPWSPPYVGPNDEIPTNAYKNVELALINPGLTHLDQPRLAPIARKLGIPYSPCMLGFEGRGGNRTPTIRGIVVHDHNAALMREASFEWESHAAEREIGERRNEILKRWKRLVVGMLMKERLDRDYG